MQVTDAQGETALSSVFSIDVRTPVTVSLKGAPSIGTVGQPYSGRIEISGGIAPYASSLSGRLAPGLSYDAGTGSIAGVPTAAGTFDGLVVQVQDADGRTGSSAAFSILVANPLVVGAPETAATVGTPFSTNTSVGGGRGPFSFSASPSVPSGLALDTSTGAISGTPTAAGVTVGFRIAVRDQDGRAASTTPRDFVVVDPFLLAASMPSIATEAVPFDGKASASGGSEPYSFFLYDGSLPKGLSLDAAAGAISGTPTSAGVYRFTIGARDASGRNAYVAASVEVVAVPTVVSAPNRVADLGKAYASSAKLQGGRAPFVWSLAAGSMPPGLTLDGTSGALSGIPTTEGLYEGMALRVVDVDGRSAVGAPFVIDVRQPLSVSGAPATDAETGIGYTSTFVASGGTPPYAWSLASGHLPGGVTLDPASGRLSGTPTQGGRFDYAVKATDAVGRTATTASHHIVVASEFSIVGQPMPTDLTVGQAFQHAYRTQNGDAPIAFSIASGTLPAGLTMSPAGVVTGTPSRAQTARGIVVAATDGAGRVSALPPMDLDVRDPVAINGNPPPGATFSRSYSARFEIVGGRGPFTFVSSGNALPPGLAYSAGWDEERQAHYGVVSGVPNALGSYTGLSASATDAAGRSGTTVPFDIHVIDAFAVEARLPGEATVGTSYQGIVTASDGQQPYVYAVAAGVLPAGLSLDPDTGTVTGTPTATGSSDGIVFSVTDARGRILQTAPAAIAVRTSLSYALSGDAFAIVGEPWSAKASVSGGREPYAFTVVGGALPPGVSFDADGNLAGFPAAAGRFVATLRMQDGDGRAAPAFVFEKSVAAAFSISGSAPSAATRGRDYSGRFVAVGGRGPYNYSLGSGVLPQGLTLDAGTGIVGGTPDRTETQQRIVVVAVDADGRRAMTPEFQIAISDNPSFARAPSGYPTTGRAFTAASAVVGGSPPYAFAVASGTLPAGLDLDTATGTVSGIATSAGAKSVVVVVTDALGASGQITATLDVRDTPTVAGAFAESAAVGETYASSIAVSGGRAPFSISNTGTLPSGLRLSAGGPSATLFGTPAMAGSATFGVEMTDADGRIVSAGPFTVRVAEALTLSGSLPSTTVGQSYSASFSAGGGREPYLYGIASGSLAPGLQLEAATGFVRGTSTASGSFHAVVSVTDGNGRSTTAERVLAVRDRIAATAAPSTLYGTVGEAFSHRPSFTGGRTPYLYSKGAGTLPDGLTLDPVTGAVAGTPTVVGVASGLRIDAVDADGDAASGHPIGIDVRLPVSVQAPSQVLVSTQTDGTWGTVSAAGGSGGYSFAVERGSLPAGLALDPATGRIAGTAPSADVTSIVVSAVDGQGRTGRSGTIEINVAPSVVATFAKPVQSLVGRSLSVTPGMAAGGAEPYSWKITSGSLPAGLSFDPATSRISGQPSSTADVVLGIRVTDATGRHADGSYEFSIRPPLAVTYPNSGRGAFTVGTASAFVPTISGGCTPSTTIVYAGGTPPTGIKLTSTGGFTYDGGSLEPGSYNFIMRTTEGCGSSVDSSITLNVATSAPRAAAPSLLKMVRGTSSALPPPVTSGGTGPFGYDTLAPLPGGLSIDTDTGSISGSVQVAAGTMLGPISIIVTDAFGRQTQTPPFSISIVDPLAIAYASSMLPFAVGTPASYGASISGGCGGLVWTIDGSHPASLGLSASTGALSDAGLSGRDIGTYGPLSIAAVDACGMQATRSLTVDVRGGPPAATAPANLRLLIGQPVSTGPATAVNMGTPSFSLTSGNLPAGLTLDTGTGAISGSFPATTKPGTSWRLVIQASDEFGRSASTPAFDLTAVTVPSLAYANGGKIGWQTGVRSIAAPTLTGGCTVTSFALAGGGLPAGVSFDASNGAVTGAFPSDGTYGPYTVQVTDACGQTATADLAIDARSGTPTATAPVQRSLAIGAASTTSAVSFSGFGASPKVEVSGSALPPGVSFDPSYRFAGTLASATQAGTLFGPYSVIVTDGYGRSSSTAAFSLKAVAAPTMSYPASTAMPVGTASTISPVVTGGATPYVFALSGALPAGLSFSAADGSIKGTPTDAGSTSGLTVSATDAAGVSFASATFVIKVTAPLAVSGTPAPAKFMVPYSHAFSASGGEAPYSFSTSGPLPTGLTLSAAGVLSGTPSAGGRYTFNVVLTDAASQTIQMSVLLEVNDASSVFAWGAGNLGRGVASDYSTTPVAATSLPPLVQVAVGPTSICGLKADGTAICWGQNAAGQLGNGTVAASTNPVAVAGGLKFSSLAAGDAGFCGITTDDNLICWGSNAKGQVGDGTGANSPTPKAIGPTGLWTSVVSGGNPNFCGTQRDGSLWCWGAGNSAMFPSTVPAKIAGTAKWRKVAIGVNNVCGVQTDGSMWCWGTSNNWMLGSSTAASSRTPVRITTESNWAEVLVDNATTCALSTEGKIICWGLNNYGSTGNLKPRNTLHLPGGVAGNGVYAALRNGPNADYCGITKDGEAHCWGYNASGQLGDGTTTEKYAPTPVDGGKRRFRDISFGLNNTYGILLP